MLAIATEFPNRLPGVAVLASRSRDGGLIVRFVETAGAEAIRGGSSSGQMEAIRSMKECVERGMAVVIAVDGPRGPFGEAKLGAVLVASQTGAPIIPVGVRCESAWVFRSWDRAYVPKPFSRVTIEYGEEIRVPREADRDTMNEARADLERRMWILHGLRHPDAE